jgi:hypothetical protein
MFVQACILVNRDLIREILQEAARKRAEEEAIRLAEAEKRKEELAELRKERDAIYTVDSGSIDQVRTMCTLWKIAHHMGDTAVLSEQIVPEFTHPHACTDVGRIHRTLNTHD